MHVRLIAVGDRQPAWVDDAFKTYSGRLPGNWRFRLDTVPTAKRGRNDPPTRAAEAEVEAILKKIKSDEQVILLDERGRALTSRQLAERVDQWQGSGRDLCFIIGGPDGVTEACHRRADLVWSLSTLTLPHGLARVMLAEQLYRGWSLLTGHPYHRD